MVISFIAVLVAAAVAAVTDARSGRIPNAVTMPLLIVGVVAQGYSARAFGVLASFAGILTCGVVPLFLFCRGAMGGGDVKLFAAIGAALGPVLGLEVQMIAYVAAALYSCAVLARRGRILHVLGAAVRLLFGKASRTAFEASEMDPSAVRLGAFVLFACALTVGRAAFGFS